MNITTGDWICVPCGQALDRRRDKNRIGTFHIGHCDYCGARDVQVTSPRDYGYPSLPSMTKGGIQ